MNKEKKIEDLLTSINNLIIEAQNANLSLNDEKGIDSFESHKIISPEIVQDKNKEKKMDNKDDWKNIKFKNYQSFLESKTTEDTDFNDKLKESLIENLEEWNRKNLKRIFENEISLKSKELIAEKLK